MLIDGEIIRDGAGIVRYLDRRLNEVMSEGKAPTGIIISTPLRKELTRACQNIMGKTYDPVETVNRFRNVLLIEDGESEERLEVVCGKKVKPPVEGNPFGRFGL